MRNVLIIGASSGGYLIANSLAEKLEEYNVVGFLDADTEKHGRIVAGFKVLGDYSHLHLTIQEHDIHDVIVAIANLEKEILYQFVDISAKSCVDLKIIPNGLEKTLHDELFSQVRTVNPSDLLGRSAITIDQGFVSKKIEGKIILITGAAGSIGSELVRQLLKFSPKKLVGIDINENDLYYLELFVKRHYPEILSEFYISNIREKESLEAPFSENPDIVFHAAAHKHVPLMEKAPVEAISNNVLGSLNVLQMSQKYSVDTFVLISSDKAVNPPNVMGATKRLAEKLTASFAKQCSGRYISVRFGNVLGSNGSVVPIFQSLIQEGQDLTLTHPDATRYFMTIPEAAQLVIEAGCRGSGGDLFVLDMGEAVRIMDLAEQLIKISEQKVGIRIIGLRPGEKLHEELFYNPDAVERIENPKILKTKSSQKVPLNIADFEKVLLSGSYKKEPRKFLKTYVESYTCDE